jgi:hypothetical protein
MMLVEPALSRKIIAEAATNPHSARLDAAEVSS